MNSHYSAVEFAPLSQASIKKMLKGNTVRVKHGSGLKLHLSKAQMKKHLSSKKKGQGGYNMTLDPYQCEMHGSGFLQDAGKFLKKNIVEPAKQEVKKQARKVASVAIHEGIPIASEVLGGLAGAYFGGNPESELAGEQVGAYGGKKLANYVGKKTGLGLKAKKSAKKPAPKKKGSSLAGGTLLIDQPFTARQAVNTAGSFIKDPAKTVGFGLKKKRGGALHNAGYGIHKN